MGWIEAKRPTGAKCHTEVRGDSCRPRAAPHAAYRERTWSRAIAWSDGTGGNLVPSLSLRNFVAELAASSRRGDSFWRLSRPIEQSSNTRGRHAFWPPYESHSATRSGRVPSVQLPESIHRNDFAFGRHLTSRKCCGACVRPSERLARIRGESRERVGDHSGFLRQCIRVLLAGALQSRARPGALTRRYRGPTR